MTKSIQKLLLLILLPVALSGQDIQKIDSLIIEGKVRLAHALNVWTESELVQARAYFERLLNQPEKIQMIHYYIALADYRLISFYFGKDLKEKAKPFVDDGINHLKSSLKNQDTFAEAHSLLSVLYGNKIAFNPLLGITLGPQSGLEMKKAMELAPKNPRNYLISGWSAYFTPKMFGGSTDKARENFKKAVALFDSFTVAHPTDPDWGHAEAYAWLGLAQVKQNQKELAQENYTNALTINPEYGWVRYVLLPELKRVK